MNLKVNKSQTPFLDWKNGVWLALILVAVGLRFFNLGSESLWNDELSSWTRSDVGTLGQLIDIAKQDVHPPGYPIFLYFWIKLFGDSEFALRLPSAIAGVWAVAFIFALGRNTYTPRVAALATGLLAVSWTPLYYAQEGRVYSMLMLASIATSYYWVKVYLVPHNRCHAPPRGEVVLLSIWSVVTVYLHYFGVLLVALQLLGGLILATRSKPLLLTVLFNGFVVVLFFAPWVPSLVSHGGREMSHLSAPALGSAIVDILKFAFSPVGPLSLLPAFALLAFPALVALRKTPEPVSMTADLALRRDIVLVLWVVLPLVFALVISHFVSPVWKDRNLIIVVPPLYLLVAASISSIPKRWISNTLAILCVIFAFFGTVIEEDYYGKTKKTQFREAVEFVCAQYEGEAVLFFAWNPRYLGYYADDCDLVANLKGPFGISSDIVEVEDLISQLEDAKFWYLSAHRKPHAEFESFLRNNFQVLESVQFRGAKAMLLQKK